MRSALVCGAVISSHLTRCLKHVGGELVDFVKPAIDDGVAEFGSRKPPMTKSSALVRRIREISSRPHGPKNLHVCGAGYLFMGDNDADIMHNSALFNLNMPEALRRHAIRRVFCSSSACIYPVYNQ